MEPGTTAKDVRAVEGQLRELADWLGLHKVAVQRKVK
jgi:hypothetical protein